MAVTLHSNYQIRWMNYKRFEDTNWITLKPLTILLGTNNAGKSSILSPLLLMAQTLASNDREAPLVPYGSLIDLGSYKDFVHLHDTSRDVFFGIRFHTHGHKPKLKPVGAYPPGGIEVTFGAGKRPEQVQLKRVEITDIYDRPYFLRALRGNAAGYSLGGAIPLESMKQDERKALESVEPVNFLFSPNDIFAKLEPQTPKDRETKPGSFSKEFTHYLRAVGFTYANVRALFGQLSYVGPLRAKLRRFYRVSAELPDTVGAQGEHAANLFRRRAGDLKDRIDSWVKRFEFGDELRYNDLTDDVFQLVFKAGSEETNVADAGFGASQVLPLIIQAAAAPNDSLTLAEQPEIHLNPRLQCVLADLFVQMATSGHRVIVETHSDHLIVRLRRLVAEGKIAADQVSLYFVERAHGASIIREIPLEQNGNIEREEWPKGFFEEGLREALALATVQSQPKEKRVKRARTKHNPSHAAS